MMWWPVAAAEEKGALSSLSFHLLLFSSYSTNTFSNELEPFVFPAQKKKKNLTIAISFFTPHFHCLIPISHTFLHDREHLSLSVCCIFPANRDLLLDNLQIIVIKWTLRNSNSIRCSWMLTEVWLHAVTILVSIRLSHYLHRVSVRSLWWKYTKKHKKNG